MLLQDLNYATVIMVPPDAFRNILTMPKTAYSVANVGIKPAQETMEYTNYALDLVSLALQSSVEPCEPSNHYPVRLSSHRRQKKPKLIAFLASGMEIGWTIW